MRARLHVYIFGYDHRCVGSGVYEIQIVVIGLDFFGVGGLDFL